MKGKRDGGDPTRRIPEETIRLRDSHPNRFPWPPHLAGLLGRMTDSALARRAGLTRRSVAAERRRRGTPPFVKPRSPIQWTASMIRLLGQASDKNVARELGLDPHTIMVKRKRLGIAPHGPVCRQPTIEWTKRGLGLLGRFSDTQVARRLGYLSLHCEIEKKRAGHSWARTRPGAMDPRGSPPSGRGPRRRGGSASRDFDPDRRQEAREAR
jgi:hypothetical protein